MFEDISSIVREIESRNEKSADFVAFELLEK